MPIHKSDLLQTGIAASFNLLVLAVPLFFTLNTEELFEFNKMVLTYALTLIILALWAARMVLHKSIIFRKTSLDIPILLFVLSQLLSTLFSIHPYTSFLGYYSRFHGGLLSTFTYVGLYYAFVSNLELKHLKGFFITLIGTATVVSIYGILEHFGYSFSCYMASGWKDFDTACWIQDVKNRVFASFGQPNWMAAYLITLLPLSIFLTQVTEKKYTKVAGIVVTTLLFMALLFTRSRSGFLGLAIGLAVYGGLLLYIWSRKDGIRFDNLFSKLKTLSLLGAIFIILSLIYETPFTPSLGALLRRTSSATPPTQTAPAASGPVNRLDVGGTDSADIRKIVWTGAYKVWQRYPIFGSGVETFAYSYYLDRPQEHNNVSEWDFLYNKAHNEFLNFLATTGIVGLLAYCGLLLSFLLFTIKRLRQAILLDKHKRALFYSSLIAGVAALTVSNFFGFSTVMVAILLFLYFALSEFFEAPLLKPTTMNSQLSSWQYTTLSIITFLCLIGAFKIYNYWSADVAYTRGRILLDQGQIDFGLLEMSKAITRNPQEALFYDTLADQYSNYALQFANMGEATDAAELKRRALETSNLVLQLNPHQINYYKTRARILINLSQLDPSLLEEAKQILNTAQQLAPTDAKIMYNLGLIELWTGNDAVGEEKLRQTIVLKPNYEAARWQLAQQYEKKKKTAEAIAEIEYILNNINPDNQLAKDRLASLSATPQR